MNEFKKYWMRKAFWLRDWLNGGFMWKDFKEVTWMMSHQDKSATLRTKKLKELFAYAITNTAYYQSYTNASRLEDFPVMNKQLYREHYKEICVDIKHIPGQVGDLHIQKTSGSTGTPFEIPQDTRSRIRRIATIKAMNELVGFHSFDTLMHLRAFAHYWGGDMVVRYDAQQNIVYADNANFTDEKLYQIVDAINKYGVHYIRGYVTAIDVISQFIVDHHIALKTRPTFITGGELLSEGLRQRIIGMKCHVTSQYANEENGVLGQSELDGNPTTIQLINANVITEILKMDSDEPAERGELGRVVVTDLTARAFPMIRYDIGDVAMVGERAVDGTILSIENLCGRSSDLILRTDGTQIDFFNSIPKEVYNSPYILQWHFAQLDKKKYILTLHVRRDIESSLREFLLEAMKQLLGQDANIEIKEVNSLPILSSGKRRVVENFYTKK